MKKLISKSVILAVMMFGAFFVANTADANAQTRCRNQRGYSNSRVLQRPRLRSGRLLSDKQQRLLQQ